MPDAKLLAASLILSTSWAASGWAFPSTSVSVPGPVVSGDLAGRRYVSSLSSLYVFDATAVPESATALHTTGLPGCFARGRRR